MKIRIPSILVILAIPVIIIALFIFGVGSLVNWKVKAALDDADKASLANQALMPGMADYVERYGMRGFQDVDLQVETCKFSSLDELYAALPSGSEKAISNALSSEPVSTSDVKGKAVKLYEKYKDGKLDERIKSRCCNFVLLEEKCKEYNNK